MNTESLAARIATARSLITDCVEVDDPDLTASDRANLQETLEFLNKLDAALSPETPDRADDGEPSDAEGHDAEAHGAKVDDADADVATRPADAEDGPGADAAEAVSVREADGKGVLFEDGEPDNDTAWIAAGPDSIERLEDWC